MNIAVIFAGGVGKRMNSKTVPKQFLKLHGKEIIIYTIEQFEQCPEIDAIIVVSLNDWIPYLERALTQNGIEKVAKVVPGGETGQESIFHGLKAAQEVGGAEKNIVLIHDGVRPLIDKETIQKNIYSVQQFGTAITIAPAIETIVETKEDGLVKKIIDRSACKLARAPQSFYLDDVLKAHERAQKDHIYDFIDTATMMKHYGYALYTVEGPAENIKITTPNDFYMFKAYFEAREASDILGV